MKKLKILSMCVFLAFSFSASFMASAHHAVQAQFAVDEFEALITRFGWGELLPLEEEFIKTCYLASFL